MVCHKEEALTIIAHFDEALLALLLALLLVLLLAILHHGEVALTD
jgi:hypothetical protein